jgi:hypothetical protein
VVYQIKDGKREPVEGWFTLLAKDAVGFKLGGYDGNREVVVDPTLVYSTYLGDAPDSANGIAMDSQGNAYVAGETGGNPFLVAFVTKFNSAGTTLLYSTYLGSGGGESGAAAIAIDSSGNAYITGYTYSFSFPVTANAFQKTNNSGVYNSSFTESCCYSADNAFITKLDSTGSTLLYSTYFGGPGTFNDANEFNSFGPIAFGDSGSGIAVDASGNAYVTGTTQGDIPTTPDAFQAGGGSFFVTKVNPLGSAVVYTSYLGGEFSLEGYAGDPPLPPPPAIAVDTSGNAYVTGGQYSYVGIPVTANAFQKAPAGSASECAFITKINPSGTALVYSTYLGGDGANRATAIAVDAAGNAYVAGSTNALDFPTTPHAFQLAPGYPYGGTAFVTKMNPTGSAATPVTIRPTSF